MKVQLLSFVATFLLKNQMVWGERGRLQNQDIGSLSDTLEVSIKPLVKLIPKDPKKKDPPKKKSSKGVFTMPSESGLPEKQLSKDPKKKDPKQEPKKKSLKGVVSTVPSESSLPEKQVPKDPKKKDPKKKDPPKKKSSKGVFTMPSKNGLPETQLSKDPKRKDPKEPKKEPIKKYKVKSHKPIKGVRDEFATKHEPEMVTRDVTTNATAGISSGDNCVLPQESTMQFTVEASLAAASA